MRSAALLVGLLCLVAAASAATSPSVFAGIWTDSAHGGQLRTCVAGNLFWGVYSGLGYIRGNISIDNGGIATASGQFYESGYTDRGTGDFQFVMNSQQTAFTGIKKTAYYRCAPSEWSETRLIGTVSPNDCLVLYEQVFDLFSLDGFTNNTLEGVWRNDVGDVMSLCFRDDTFQVSISNLDLFGYAHGRAALDGRLGRATIYRTRFAGGIANVGIAMFLLADPRNVSQALVSNNGTKLYLLEISGVEAAADVDVLDPTLSFSTSVWTRITNETDTPVLTYELCAANGLGFFSGVESVWNGAWTDWDFGFGRLYICVDGNRVQGVFSELGIIDGVLRSDGRSIHGRFYDAGDTVQVSGDFDLAIDQDRDHFVGWWRFDNSAKKYHWNESRVSDVTPSQLQCLASSVQGYSIHGTWRYDSLISRDLLDICILPDDATRFEASYNFNGGQDRGYLVGQVRDDGRLMQCQWFENGKSGICMLMLLSPTQLHYVRWNHADIQASTYFVCDGDLGNVLWVRHRAITFNQRLTITTTNTSCHRNSDLIQFKPNTKFTPAGFVDNYALEYTPYKEIKRPKRGMRNAATATVAAPLFVMLLAALALFL